MRDFIKFKVTELGLGDFMLIFEFLYRLALCIIAVIVGYIIFKLLSGTLKKAIRRKGSTKKTDTILTLCTSILRYFMYFCVFCQFLLIFGISPASILAVAGVGSVALGLGAQHFVEDIISGLFILLEDQYEVGDVIKIEGYEGTVEAIGLKTTKLRNYNGDVYIIPNGEIKIVTNSCKEFNRALLEISVAYESDMDRVYEVLEDELEKAWKSENEEERLSGIIAKPQILGITDLGDSAITIRMSIDCEPGKQWEIERKLRLRIKKRFDREDIVIPYPQRVVYIRKEE